MLWEPTAPLLSRIVVNGGRAAAGAACCRAEGSGGGAVPRDAAAEDAKPGPAASPAAPRPLPRPLPSPAPCISASLCPLLLRCQYLYFCTSKASKLLLLPLCHAAPIRCSSSVSFFVFTALMLVTGRGHETGEFFFALDTKSPPTSTSRSACPPSRPPRAS